MTKRIQESKLDINYNGIFREVITEFTFLKILSEYVKTGQSKKSILFILAMILSMLKVANR